MSQCDQNESVTMNPQLHLPQYCLTAFVTIGCLMGCQENPLRLSQASAVEHAAPVMSKNAWDLDCGRLKQVQPRETVARQNRAIPRAPQSRSSQWRFTNSARLQNMTGLTWECQRGDIVCLIYCCSRVTHTHVPTGNWHGEWGSRGAHTSSLKGPVVTHIHTALYASNVPNDPIPNRLIH